ncbi:hypothetical protein BDR06DRAFT_978108 [Suillus hirtellus]|nr:hypothetical protein BDR06DRAFT_978108 [Suillus hirtellus]
MAICSSGRQSLSASARGNTAPKTTATPSDTDVVALFNPDVHICDIGEFAQVGFNEQVQRLADDTGSQGHTVRNAYKNVGSFIETEEVMKAMRKAALECAEDEIGKRAAGE